MKSSRRTTEKASEAEHDVIRTSGEFFPDGSAIELVTTGATNGNKPALLFWNGKKAISAPQVENGGHLYQPIQLHDSLQRAIRFPRGVASYGNTREFLTAVASLFERYTGCSRGEAALITAWNTSTWFSDCWSNPPTLLVSGPEMDQAITLFRLLHALARRPLMLAEITRSAIRSLPMFVRPTLIVNQPDLSPKILGSWRASNYRGLFVPGNGGVVLDVVCSKAAFLGMEGAADSWSDAALHVALPPAQPRLPSLDEREQERIADQFQPRFLNYRLCHLPAVREARPVAGQLKILNSELARNLLACIQGEPESAQAMAPLLQSHEQDLLARRGCDVTLAIVEVIWVPLHEAKEITMSRITELTNALLRCRGETLEYRTEEIGWKLRNLGLCRHRNGNGMVLRFSRETRLRIHQHAQRFGLALAAVDDCSDCRHQPEVVVAQ